MNDRFKVFVKPTIDATLLPGPGFAVFWLRESALWLDDEGFVHETPRAGYLSDGYSVPPLMWSLIRGLPCMLPAFNHDEQYQRGVPRWTADQNIYRGIISVGGPKWTAMKVWAGLQIGGWAPYRRYARMREQGVDVVALRTANTLEEAREKAMQRCV